MLETRFDTLGGFSPNVLKMATSSANDFIPLVVLEALQGLNNTPIYEYFRPAFLGAFMSNSMKHVLEALNWRNNLINIEATSGGAKIHLGKGYICDNLDRILLVLTAKKESYDRYSGNYNFYAQSVPEDYMMFISTELVTNPDYGNFYRRLHKDYISHCYLKGIEVRIISSEKIEKSTFANELDLRFSSVPELSRHLEEEVGTLLALQRNQFNSMPPRAESFDEFLSEGIREETIHANPITTDTIMAYGLAHLARRHAHDREVILNSIGVPIQASEEIRVHIPGIPEPYVYHTLTGSGGTVIEPILGDPGYFRVVSNLSPNLEGAEVIDFVTFSTMIGDEIGTSSIPIRRVTQALDLDTAERERQVLEGRLPLLEDEDSEAVEGDPFGDEAAHYGDEESSYETVEQSIQNLDEEGDEEGDLPY